MLRKLLVCLFVVGNSANVFANTYGEQLEKNGFVEIKNPHITKKEYNKAYKFFEDMILLESSNKSFSDKLKNLENEFLKTPYKNIFCGAPAGCYRDCTAEKHKVDDKKYFQYSAEFHEFLNIDYPKVFEEYPVFSNFLNQLKEIDSGAKKSFSEILSSLKQSHPELVKALYGDRKEELTVITKVLSYDPSSKDLGTSPHYDKCGVTLILDNDDLVNDRLVLSSYQENFDFSLLKAPTRKFEDNPSSYSSSLLIVGSLPKHQRLKINPTPHAVLPVSSEKSRHSLISFALFPKIDMTGVSTIIVDKKKIQR